MHHHYSDIRNRIAEAPKWWDEEAVPRYCEFGPDEAANIYAVEVALVEIKCQACGTPFRVAFAWDRHNSGQDENGKWWITGREAMTVERVKRLHYGDPPNAGCCAPGPTMNSEPQRVLEFWRQENFKWVRVPELEVAIDCEWAAAPEGP